MDIKVVTICGSMKFATEMQKIATRLEIEKGWCVLQCVYGIDQKSLTEEESNRIRDAHWRKIDISDAIYVVNIGGYIGTATNNEINYALRNGKEVIYHQN